MTAPYSPYILTSGVKLIGITGKAGAGKDTIADYLFDKYTDIGVEPFAAPLKDAARAAFGFSEEQVYGSAKETLDDFWKVTPRQVLQFMGTEMFRQTIGKLIPGVEDDFWVQRMYGRLSGQIVPEDGQEYLVGDIVVIPDTRFQNEYDFIIANGGILINVVRPGVGEVGIMGHASEAGFKLHEGAKNYEVINDGTLNQLYDRVDQILETLDI